MWVLWSIISKFVNFIIIYDSVTVGFIIVRWVYLILIIMSLVFMYIFIFIDYVVIVIPEICSIILLLFY